MIVGYTLYGNDNDSFMLNDDHNPDIDKCPKCGYILDFEYHNPFYKLKRKTYDFSHPYDIGHIVSLRFKEFCIRENYKGVFFKEFELQPNFFQFIVNNIVQFDTDKQKLELLEYCKTCKTFEEVIGPYPVVLKDVSEKLKDGFYRTDLYFGSKNRKNPVIIVGVDTYNKLKREKMKGLIFEEVEM